MEHFFPFLKQKYILLLATYIFKIFIKHLIASVFFLPRQALKNIDSTKASAFADCRGEFWTLKLDLRWNKNWSSYFKQFKSLVLKFWAQDSLCQSDCLILSHQISPEWLVLLTSVFARQFSIMIETYLISVGRWWVLEFFAVVP